MTELFPIGTVVQIDSGTKYCIIGHAEKEKEGKTLCGYYVVPYPLGYIDFKRLFFLPLTTPCTVLAYGYQNAAGDSFLDLIGKTFDLTGKYPTADLQALAEKCRSIIEKEAE